MAHDPASWPNLPLRRILLSAALVLPAAPAYCQSPGLAGQDRLGAAPFGTAPSAPDQPARASRSSLPPIASLGQPWPRLEPGATLCRTQDDLRRHAAALVDPTAAPPEHCHAVGRATPIAILDRAGPGATQVKVTAPDGETGWTDAFLPAKAPLR